VSCYLGRLEDVLLAAGVRHTRDNRRRIHAVIQEMTGEKDCPRVWRRVNAIPIREDSWERFVAELRERSRRQPVAD
jgi:hypothetical protein